ncbi:ABC transporter permease [Corynebacterium incognita]|uniref:ABC transporter permease n=1 Tax=Corynebacterium incognita TaxID=2754725 RepID=A0A7G7CQY1_9CORY|nr:ABC transporter permease [Corynebacterium incognita]QNE89997.1 ABC transporter permease [Corynebacterium incognita]
MTSLLRRLPATGWVGLVLVALTLLTALVSLVWTPYDPTYADAAARLQGPGAEHLLGTDRYGRDTLSRIMAGAQITVFVGLVAVGISALVGVPLGMLAGMRRGGFVDALVGRTNDLLLAFPALLTAIMAGAVFGASTLTAMAAIGIAGIPAFARLTRSGTLQVINQDYISAARISRVPHLIIAVRHVLPNILGLIIVQASVAFALAILAEAGLSYLGLGTPPPTPSWGRMLQDSQTMLGTDPLLAVFPGVAIALTVLGFNLLGDGLRDIFDPRMKGRR